MTVMEQLSEYLHYYFVQYALIACVPIALCSSLLGVTLVLKRFSFIGDSLSHVAFGAMAVAGIMGFTNEMMLVLPVTIIAAIVLLATGSKAKIKGDASLAMLSVSALGIGYLLLSVSNSSGGIRGDACTTLFGSQSILSLSTLDVIVCIFMSLVVIVLFIFFYNRIFSVTFDEDFSVATDTKASFYNLLIAVITAIIIVLAMNLVGSLLISALVIFPALSAMRVFKSFRSVVICSAIVSSVCALSGILVSIVAGTPIGSTIVATDIVVFALFYLTGKVLRRS